MEHRVDGVIQKVREMHQKYLRGECDHRDVLIVAHGHFNRVMIARWIRFPLSLGMFLLSGVIISEINWLPPGTHFNVEPGSVSLPSFARLHSHHSQVTILGYNHNNMEEPALNALNLYATIQ